MFFLACCMWVVVGGILCFCISHAMLEYGFERQYKVIWYSKGVCIDVGVFVFYLKQTDEKRQG